jgi:hypothetical protein
MHVLDEPMSATVRSVCEAVVPGCGRVAPEVYVDAVVARMPAAEREATLAAFAGLGERVSQGPEGLAECVQDPEFMLVRALACEAFYSDFVAPGAPGPGAWAEIDFAPPLAARLLKDWSYLGVVR